MTENHNIIKEALEEAQVFAGRTSKINAALALIEKSETEEALLPCPFCGSSEVNKTTYDVKIVCPDCVTVGPFGKTKEEAIKAWNTRTPEGQEMWAVETQVGYSNFLSRNKDDADYRCKELTTIMPEIGPFKVVPVIVTKKED